MSESQSDDDDIPWSFRTHFCEKEKLFVTGGKYCFYNKRENWGTDPYLRKLDELRFAFAMSYRDAETCLVLLEGEEEDKLWAIPRKYLCPMFRGGVKGAVVGLNGFFSPRQETRRVLLPIPTSSNKLENN